MPAAAPVFERLERFSRRRRNVQRWFGGGDQKELGPVKVGEISVVPEPTFTFGPLTSDHPQQGTAGLSYDMLWAGIGAMGLGVQKSLYRRTILAPTLAPAKAKAKP